MCQNSQKAFFCLCELDFSLPKSQICCTTMSDLLVTAPSFMRTSKEWIWPEVFISDNENCWFLHPKKKPTRCFSSVGVPVWREREALACWPALEGIWSQWQIINFIIMTYWRFFFCAITAFTHRPPMSLFFRVQTTSLPGHCPGEQRERTDHLLCSPGKERPSSSVLNTLQKVLAVFFWYWTILLTGVLCGRGWCIQKGGSGDSRKQFMCF